MKSLSKIALASAVIASLTTPSTQALESISTQYWNYSLPRELYYPGHTARLIKNGTFVGKFEATTQGASTDPAKQSTPTFTEELQQMLESVKKENTVTQDLRTQAQKALAELKKKWEAIRGEAGKAEIPKPSPSASPQTEAPQMDEFLKCVPTQLPQLKDLIQKQRWLATAESEQRLLIQGRSRDLQNKINRERLQKGSGESPSITCGRHLKRAAFALPTIEDEVKLFTALVRRSGQEQMRVLSTAWVAFASDSERGTLTAAPGLSDLWQLYWKMLSLEAVFAERALSTYEELQAQLLTRLKQQYHEQAEVLFDAATITELTKAGVAQAREVLGEDVK